MAVTINDLAAIGSREAFGAVLAPQGRGYYVTLELLALVWGDDAPQRHGASLACRCKDRYG